ncbi:uncharacterized protein Dwil_GK24761 [Drosophila willistoni]|uniref:Uncharacterized protein n=1 Tax=Drosophila willistoni TaxID=7260 RepID=B4N022_DROWI|nr:uncharacterized protein LOC6643974 [Drosophila willistoni]EDW77957.1 uncharacterized protein Dwil_GK24761 [Drosophila willistoni]
MRLKEHSDIIFDVIPKLYESHSKVFITHLHNVEKQLERLPKKFCKMYTNRSLASQLLCYLTSRNASISESDFHIVEDAKPFQLRLSDGKRLEVMLCAGNELKNSLMLLIRRIQGGPLLYYYSAVQQDDLWRLMGNDTYNAWIAQGTEILYLNLQHANQTEVLHYDYDEIAESIIKFAEERERKVLIKLPLFGYEYVIRSLAYTQLYGHIHLMGCFGDAYRHLTNDMQRFNNPNFAETVQVCSLADSIGTEDLVEFPVTQLKWTPVPTRVNLKQLCSLLRPKHIHGIVAYHALGNAPPAPSYLQALRSTFSPNALRRKMEMHHGSANAKSDIRHAKRRRIDYVDDASDSN